MVTFLVFIYALIESIKCSDNPSFLTLQACKSFINLFSDDSVELYCCVRGEGFIITTTPCIEQDLSFEFIVHKNMDGEKIHVPAKNIVTLQTCKSMQNHRMWLWISHECCRIGISGDHWYLCTRLRHEVVDVHELPTS
eukprot:494063_1